MKHVPFLLLIFLIYATLSFSQENTIIHEKFNNLDNWETFAFPNIKKHSSYKIVMDNADSVLGASSTASASAIIYNKTFNPYESSILTWRWKIENVIEKGNAKAKSGDDYPIRIYIMFSYDPDKAGFVDKLKYNSAKILYGYYPPHSVLNYIWANQEHSEHILTNTYTEKAKMILLEKGNKFAGIWRQEKVNIIDDYRAAFGNEPPQEARLAIMADTDNTGESSTAFVDDIIIRK